MNTRRARVAGFTLVEAMVSIVLVVLGVAMALTGFLYVVKSESIISVQSELDLDTQKAMERLKRDLRLSSLDNMFFYPAGAAEFEAISFPVAEDSDGDGLIETDADGKIAWDRQIIYHVRRSTPDELRVTTFSTRNNTLTDAQRQAQLNWTVEQGSGAGTHEGSNSTTFTVFRNLVEFKIRPRAAEFDGYASALTRDTVGLGTYILLSPGSHDFTFTVIGKNASSSGYAVGVDSMYISPSYSVREGEAQTVASNSPSAVPTATEIRTGSWSGNHHLFAGATGTNVYFTLRMHNDAWEEVNFQDSGVSHDGTLTAYDETGTPHDFVVRLEGGVTNWQAVRQVIGTNTTAISSNSLCDATVRVLCRGRSMVDGGWIEASGSRTRFCFRAGSAGGLSIGRASVVECESDFTPSMNASNTPLRLTFATDEDRDIAAGSSAWTDWANFPVDASKSYLVTYSVKNMAGRGSPQVWVGSGATPSTYVIAGGGNGPVDQANWTVYTNATATANVIGLESVHCSFLSNGVFTSQVMDTRVSSPSYSTWAWASTTNGGSTAVKFRTGTDSGMSDAPDWSAVAPQAGSSLSLLASRRYAQFQLLLGAPGDCQATPKVHSVTARWLGETNVVLVGGTFTKGPNYGIFRLTVDGRELKSGLQVDLSLYKDVRGFVRTGAQRIESFLTAEVMPRNTGR
jgi:type II secretory pathway pseudopilin PulG